MKTKWTSIPNETERNDRLTSSQQKSDNEPSSVFSRLSDFCSAKISSFLFRRMLKSGSEKRLFAISFNVITFSPSLSLVCVCVQKT